MRLQSLCRIRCCRLARCFKLALCLVFFLVLLYLTGVYDDATIQNYLSSFIHKGFDELPYTTNLPFLVNTSSCWIPGFDPFDPEVLRRYISKKTPLNCAGRHPVLVESNLTALYVVRTALRAYRISDVDQLECCYRPFWRVTGNLDKYSQGVDDKVRFSPNCTVFRREVAVRDEVVEVTCSVGRRVVYRDFHAFFPVKAAVEERCARTKQLAEALSVIMVGVDSVSRLNLHRQMPLTVAQLAEMDAIEMLGYNKVGDNTFPFFVAALSGLSEDELKAKCWPNYDTSLDHCHWIWNTLSDAGYRTAFGEDAPDFAAFNYLKVGFVNQPTDYYMRPYSIVSERLNGHNWGYCNGPRMSVEPILQYASKFARTAPLSLKFGLFHATSLTHNIMNYANLGDHIHRDFLWELAASYSLNKTVLVYYSDHGIRFGDFLETYQGRMEGRLPFLFFIFPSWFRVRYSLAVFNLETNARRLITAFDLHSTLLDFADLGRIENDAIRRRTRDELKPLPRGISLFLRIPENRTCRDAGIEPHWCTCEKTRLLSTSTPEVNTMAHILLDHLNTMLQPHRRCSQLELAEIRDARLKIPGGNPQGIEDYELLVRTTPGDALLGATVRHYLRNNTKRVMGSVSRVNKYGNQGKCVKDFHMKLYCFCKQFLVF